MAKRFNYEQTSIEIQTYYLNLVLPSGVTAISATAVHTPPSGEPTSPTASVVPADNQVQVQFGPVGEVFGNHELSVRVSLDNGDLPEIIYTIKVDH